MPLIDVNEPYIKKVSWYEAPVVGSADTGRWDATSWLRDLLICVLCPMLS